MSKDKQPTTKDLGNAIRTTAMAQGEKPESWANRVWSAATGSKGK